jgi:NAD-dependent SIR2 family protein deacetylase
MPTEFHKLLDRNSDRVIHLTQNIDCLEDKLPSLPHKTVRLHGRVDTLVCQLNSIHTFQVTPEDFEKKVRSRCPKCKEADEKRVANNKRSHGVGVLLPKVLLYGADADDVIEKRLLDDLFRKVDAVIIAGTPLKCKSVRVLARELCRAAKWNNGLTVWVNKRRPDSEFESLLDYVVEGDCDEFASALLVQDV